MTEYKFAMVKVTEGYPQKGTIVSLHRTLHAAYRAERHWLRVYPIWYDRDRTIPPRRGSFAALYVDASTTYVLARRPSCDGRQS